MILVTTFILQFIITFYGYVYKKWLFWQYFCLLFTKIVPDGQKSSYNYIKGHYLSNNLTTRLKRNYLQDPEGNAKMV